MLFAATIEDTPGMAAARRGVRAAPAGRAGGFARVAIRPDRIAVPDGAMAG